MTCATSGGAETIFCTDSFLTGKNRSCSKFHRKNQLQIFCSDNSCATIARRLKSLLNIFLRCDVKETGKQSANNSSWGRLKNSKPGNLAWSQPQSACLKLGAPKGRGIFTSVGSEPTVLKFASRSPPR